MSYIDGIVCPTKMRGGLLLMAAVDNLDYNHNATTANNSFHLTGISLIQHLFHTFGDHDLGILIIVQAIPHGKTIALFHRNILVCFHHKRIQGVYC